MTATGLFTLIAAISALLFLLSWVGWRFFVSPQRAVPNSPTAEPWLTRLAGRLPAMQLPQWRPGATLGRQLGLGLLTGVVSVGSILLLADQVSPDPLMVFESERQAHIQAALNPERLVPPPPLPPLMFISSERPALESADRDWNKLNPDFMQQILLVLARLEGRGYPFALLEGYRSPERQEKLADLGSHVTSARAFQSKHQFGLAADLAPVRGGKLIISERDPWAMEAYLALGEEAEKAGLTWGGRWWFKDYGHLERSGPLIDKQRLSR